MGLDIRALRRRLKASSRGKETDMTRDELLIYEKACGTESAINLLLLGGSDHYAGDYDQTMAELEARREEA